MSADREKNIISIQNTFTTLQLKDFPLLLIVSFISYILNLNLKWLLYLKYQRTAIKYFSQKKKNIKICQTSEFDDHFLREFELHHQKAIFF